MFEKLEQQIKKLFKKKETQKEPYERLIQKIEGKIEKLKGKKDEKSLEELSIYTILLKKLKKRLKKIQND